MLVASHPSIHLACPFQCRLVWYLVQNDITICDYECVSAFKCGQSHVVSWVSFFSLWLRLEIVTNCCAVSANAVPFEHEFLFLNELRKCWKITDTTLWPLLPRIAAVKTVLLLTGAIIFLSLICNDDNKLPFFLLLDYHTNCDILLKWPY